MTTWLFNLLSRDCSNLPWSIFASSAQRCTVRRGSRERPSVRASPCRGALSKRIEAEMAPPRPWRRFPNTPAGTLICKPSCPKAARPCESICVMNWVAPSPKASSRVVWRSKPPAPRMAVRWLRREVLPWAARVAFVAGSSIKGCVTFSADGAGGLRRPNISRSSSPKMFSVKRKDSARTTPTCSAPPRIPDCTCPHHRMSILATSQSSRQRTTSDESVRKTRCDVKQARPYMAFVNDAKLVRKPEKHQ